VTEEGSLRWLEEGTDKLITSFEIEGIKVNNFGSANLIAEFCILFYSCTTSCLLFHDVFENNITKTLLSIEHITVDVIPG
jgi:hypothetical protein